MDKLYSYISSVCAAWRNVLLRVSSWRGLAVFVVLSLTAYSLLRALQGFNMCDDGFVLSSYRQVSASPGSVAYMFLYYWMLCVGGAWNDVFGGLGIYGFRVLEVLVLTANSLLVVRLFGGMGRAGWVASAGLVLVYSRLNWIEVFEYNTFTAFAVLLVLAFMMKALVGRGVRWMFAAGVVLGLGYFVRIPNVCMSLLVLVLVPFYYYTRDKRLTLRLFTSAVAGAFSGVALTAVHVWGTGRMPYFAEAVGDMFFLLTDAGNTHGSGGMLLNLCRNWGLMAGLFLLFAACPALSAVVVRRVGGRRARLLCVAVLLSADALIVLCCSYLMVYVVYMLAVASCVYVACAWHHSPRVVYLPVLALLVAVLFPLGSDLGVQSVGVHGLWAAMPFVPYAARTLLRRFDGVRRMVVGSFVALTLVLVLMRGVYDTLRPAYYEPGTRFADVHAVGHPLANVYTDAGTASAVNSVLGAMEAEVTVGDTVLFMGDVTMLNYLTDTRPYLHNPWPSVFGAGYFERKAAWLCRSGEPLPVTVCSRSCYYGGGDLSRSFRRFLDGNRYRLAYSDGIFMMFVPTRRNGGAAVFGR